MNMKFVIATVALMLIAHGATRAQSPATSPVPVTVDNFVRAEFDTYLAGLAEVLGGLAKLPIIIVSRHLSQPADCHPAHPRYVVLLRHFRSRRRGPVTIMMPDDGKSFHVAEVFVSQDHYTTTEYGKGAHALTRDKVGRAMRSLPSAHFGRSQ